MINTKLILNFLFIILLNLYSNNTFSSEKNDIYKFKIQNYFKNLKTLKADFIQISPRGDISKGKLYLSLPGKLRFEYYPPHKLLITCQGYFIKIQNLKLKTTSNIPVHKTPFSILLDEKINFYDDKYLIKTNNDLGVIGMSIKIKNNIDIGELFLEFSELPFNFKKWIIKDALGEETKVLIQNTQTGIDLDYKIFFPEDFPINEN